MGRKIPKVGCHWHDKTTDDLGDCHFEVFFCKIDEIPYECNGTPRKQTKSETISEGLLGMHNAQAAANLVGSKFMISRSGKRLHVTTMPTKILRKFNLPEDYASVAGPLKENISPKQSNASTGGFDAFAASPTPPAADEDKRLGLAAKCMFLQLAASLDVIYQDNSEDLYIVEVKAKPNPASIIEAVFDSGEHFEGSDAFNLSFGLIKQVEA